MGTEVVINANAEILHKIPNGDFRSPLLKKEMPGLDALRGVAILAVLFYHGLHVEKVEDLPAHSTLARVVSSLLGSGWLGVFLFFVLSGFLITGILLDSKESPQYWQEFYVRRVLRIIPVFLLVLVILKLFFGSTWLYVLVCMVYVANLAPAFHIGGFIYSRLWSLAVEEQFYLGWPWLVKRLNKKALACVAIGCIVLCPFLRFWSLKGFAWLGDPHRMTWLLADNLAMGALLAILLRSKWGQLRSAKFFMWGFLALGVAIFGIGVPFGIAHWDSPVGAALKTVPFELIFAGVLLLFLYVGGHPAVLALTRPMQFCGYISYGLYLYHGLVFMTIDRLILGPAEHKHWNGTGWFLRFSVGASISILVAFLSRRYFEAFFLRIGRGRRERIKLRPKPDWRGSSDPIPLYTKQQLRTDTACPTADYASEP